MPIDSRQKPLVYGAATTGSLVLVSLFAAHQHLGSGFFNVVIGMIAIAVLVAFAKSQLFILLVPWALSFPLELFLFVTTYDKKHGLYENLIVRYACVLFFAACLWYAAEIININSDRWMFAREYGERAGLTREAAAKFKSYAESSGDRLKHQGIDRVFNDFIETQISRESDLSFEDLGFTKEFQSRNAEVLFDSHRDKKEWAVYLGQERNRPLSEDGKLLQNAGTGKQLIRFGSKEREYQVFRPPNPMPQGSGAAIQWLRKIKEESEEKKSKAFFHGTNTNSAGSICRDGIDLRRSETYQDFSHAHGFYVTDDIQEAFNYAQHKGNDGESWPAVVAFVLPCNKYDELKIAQLSRDRRLWKKVVFVFKSKKATSRECDEVREKYDREFDAMHGEICGTKSNDLLDAEDAKPKQQQPPSSQLCLKSRKARDLFDSCIAGVLVLQRK